MLRPSGFVEYNPSEQLIFDQLVEIIKKNYEKFWYTHIHTPAVEDNSVLLSKNGEETGKQIFWLYGLAQGAEDLKEYALHFDLTVPFARYVLDRENELTFPFKRYQMQPVRRGERAQKGRFREFTQCDIDVIWRKDTAGDYLFYDAEVIFTLSQALTAILTQMHLADTAVMHISNKKLILGFLESLLTNEQIPLVTSLIDKYKKIGLENFKSSLQDLGISSENIDKLCNFITLKCHSSEISKIANFADTSRFQEGYTELEKLVTYLETFKQSFNTSCEYLIDLQIIRGLDYYTWTVFEAFLEQDETLWSICGGGRYGELTKYLDPKRDLYAGVGGSIGISRLLSKIFEEQTSAQNTVAEYLFINFQETFPDILRLASKFQQEGKNIEIFPSSEKLGKQFWLADKRGIPYVVILGEGEKTERVYKIKELQTWSETTVPLD